ncbi:carbohydrate ABC transporter permease [Lachnospiraceae bacterium ZAX-1]
MTKKIKPSSVILNVVVVCIAFTCVFPLVWLLYSSLKTEDAFLGRPFDLPTIPLQWENFYHALVRSKIANYFFNTLIYAVGAVLLVLFFAFCIGYCMSRYRFRGKALVTGLLTLGMVVPAYALLVPMYMQYNILGIVNTRGVLMFPYLAVNLPLGVFLIEAYIKNIPYEMEQAAQLEGANLFQTITQVIIPMSKPILITVAILTFNFVWNEMPFALVLTPNEKIRNMAVGLMNFASGYDANFTYRLAACVVGLIPVTLLYIIFNRQIIKGMTEGSVKG